MPRHISYQIRWSPSAQDYILLHDGKPLTPTIQPASQDWFDWLETIASFSFENRSGAACTVRKESVQRGGAYWYAYQRHERQMVKRYLARSADLTLAHLEKVTATLGATEPSSKLTTLAMAKVEGSLLNAEQEPRSTSVAFTAKTLTQSQLLITAKLRIPRLPTQHIPRPRLLTLLQQGTHGSLTLVSAPAGSGKTTLLTEWATTTKLPVAWISLEAADNDPLRFLSYFVAALAGLDTTLAAVTGTYQRSNTQDVEQVLTGILNDLTRLLHQDMAVILDDFHVLTTDTMQEILRTLFIHLPPHLHLVIGTRIDPPLALARLRAQRQLSEVHTEELRFVASEIESLVLAMGLTLSHEAVDLLEQHTEGWIAGIQLLTLALQGHNDATAFLQAFRGTHRFLLDYLSEEVLIQQVAETQRFLLLTSILERMTGPLCDAVTKLSGGQSRLTELLRANLFVSTLDDTETWFRYHPLFANALRTHLQKLEPDLIPQLYLRASAWHEQQQNLEEACDYAFLAGDLPHAAKLVAQCLPLMIEQGYVEQLNHWLEQLPPNLIEHNPQLYIALPWRLSLNKRPPEIAEQALKNMEQYIQEQQQDATTSWVEPQSVLTLFRAITAISQNMPLRAFVLTNEALRLLTTSETGLSQILTRFTQIVLSLLYGARGDLANTEKILLDLSIAQLNKPPSLINLVVEFLLSELSRIRGQLHKAQSHYDILSQTLELLVPLPPAVLFFTYFTLLRKVSLFYEWNRLPEAAHTAQYLLEVMPRAQQFPFLGFGLWAQARIELAQGQPEAARYFLELIHNQPEICGEADPDNNRPPVDVPMLAARLALACNQIEVAEHWASICAIHFDDVPKTLYECRQIFAYLTLARILIIRGRTMKMEIAFVQALILLKHWRERAKQFDCQGWLIEIQMLTALVLHAQGKTRQALITLGQVLVLAEPEGYLRLFADEGQPMAFLLVQVSEYTTASPNYLQRLQAANPYTPQKLLSPGGSETSQALTEPLSTRELEVLSLVANGASNQQIADKLVISLNTTKSHIKHILSKLAVSNRTQAVMHARKLNLL